MASHATALSLSCSRWNQDTASEVLPNPAGALRTANRFLASWEVTLRSRGRSISPWHRGGTTLVARNWRCFPPSTEPLGGGGPLTALTEFGSVKGTFRFKA